jgi:polyhydroxybutyrate depolymerase
MIRACVLVALALAALAVACDGDDPPEAETVSTAMVAPPNQCTPDRPHAPGRSRQSIESSGLERSYILHIPSGYDGTTPAPLVLGFHSFTTDAEVWANYTSFTDAADTEGFVVAMPDGLGELRRWNIRQDVTQADDLLFARDLIAHLDETLCIDANRTYAAGFSNGGGMAQLLACSVPERIAAVGVVAATYLACMADVPLVAFHGINDLVVPYEGGENLPEGGGGVFLNVRRVVSEWAQTAGCDGLARISRPVSEVELSTFVRCRGGDGEVLLYAVINGGHTWPGAPPLEVVGFTTTQIDASETIVEFFASHPPAE